MDDNFNRFTNLYPVSKTLRFELRPIGKTLENLSEVIRKDSLLADNFSKVKQIIDSYHKSFIEETLSFFSIKNTKDGENPLEQFAYYYGEEGSNDPKREEKLTSISETIRKQIADRFSSNDKFKRLFAKELIQQDLPAFVKNPDYKPLPGSSVEEDFAIVAAFKEFTTYFTEFHQNRKNIYSKEDISTSIGHRIVSDNLPKFLDNIRAFKEICDSPLKEEVLSIFDSFKDRLQVASLEEVFSIGFFNFTLTQSGIELYNAIIGGVAKIDEKQQGINELVNLYNQQQTNKKDRLPRLKFLYKQILSDRNQVSYLPEQFTSPQQMLDSIKEYVTLFDEAVNGTPSSSNLSLVSLLSGLDSYNKDAIFWTSGLPLTDISQKVFDSWEYIQDAIKSNIKTQEPKKKKETDEKYEERINAILKKNGSYSLGYLQSCLGGEGAKLTDYIKEQLSSEKGPFEMFKVKYHAAIPLLSEHYPEDRNLANDNCAVQILKALLDSMKEIQFFVKPLLGSGKEAFKDDIFYYEFTRLWETIDLCTPLYNKVRNFCTKKPYSTEKIKLNFDNSTLMNGWDVNKEHDNTSVILRKGGLYYLAIMRKDSNKIFDNITCEEGADFYEKMDYKLLPGANKMLPKVFFSDKGKKTFCPSQDILRIYEKGTFKKGESFNLEDCHVLIDFFKEGISKHEDWSKFNFRFSPTSRYKDISDFYREVEDMGYKITFRKVDVQYVQEMVEEGKLFLFQIYNKDFSPYSKGVPNMHTLYWRMLFDEANLRDVVYKLNGEAEVFFRKASIKYDHPTHPAGVPVDNKNLENIKRQSVFEYDLIKDKRFTLDKFMFHVPMTMNFKSHGQENINSMVNDYIARSQNLHVIGIDRGERNLLYLTVIDSEGRIVEQMSLNQILNSYAGIQHVTDYHKLLDAKESLRDDARKSWKTIENIKELKEGYLSQVVHVISQMVIKYNAIVVLEDLNRGFMRGRQKVEKQVYEKFEKMLIDKLNYLVPDKTSPVDVPGGLLHAYQLTSKAATLREAGKQCGILFYVPAWMTSKIDPTTGFVNLFNMRYETVDKSREFFGDFTSIRYNSSEDWFEFEFDYHNFTTKADGTRTTWTVCTKGERVETFRNKEKNSEWDNRTIDLTKELKELFSGKGIRLEDNLKESIVAKSDKEFFEKLLRLFRMTLSMRNSITGTDVDYITSPVKNEYGCFYDSRTCDKTVLPKDADANGAFNIARKGLMIVKRIKEATDGEKVDMFISEKDWLNYAQNITSRN